MKKYVRCKSCGFIMEAGRLGDACPACGVPGKMFEEYTPDISEKRAAILDAHIHPVIVHAPQAFAFFTLVFTVIFAFALGELRLGIFWTLRVLSFCLPIVALAAIASGILDGLTRFRKLKSSILKRKVALGVTFFVFSAAMLTLALFFELDEPLILVLFGVSNLVCFIASAFLGLLGSSILNSRFPG